MRAVVSGGERVDERGVAVDVRAVAMKLPGFGASRRAGWA